MPRVAHGRPLLKSGLSRPPKRKSKYNTALNALETAERQNPDLVRIRQHRLGEVEDDSDLPETRADADERSNKRRKVSNTRAEEDDDADGGSDLEGGTWHTGVDNEDEDSDLDSDEAFGESDEEKFADFTFRGSGKQEPRSNTTRTRKSKSFDLSENTQDEDEDSSESGHQQDDGLGDEAVDLATAWDMDDLDQLPKRGTKEMATARQKASYELDVSSASETSVSHSDGSDDISEDEDASENSESDESQLSVSENDLDGDTTGLRTFVEELSRPRQDGQKRTKAVAKAMSNEPSRFGLSNTKLSAADLLQFVKDPTQRQSIRILQSAEDTGPEQYKGGIPGKLSAPLVKRQQDRLNRGAAYEKSKETLNKWIDTVKQNRRAEHLSFPLIDHEKESVLGQKQLMPTTQSAPINDLEATLQEIMQESGMGSAKGQSTEDQEQAFEELAEKKMDIAEVKARRAELRMARELMFREEIKAKRIKKIKSKAFRRVHRKEKDRIDAQQRESLAAAGLLNSDEEREKQDRQRAEERMGARHRESKWAKGVKQVGRAAWDEDARAGVSDLARRDDELRRRISGKDVKNTEASDADSESESDYGDDTDTESRNISERLSALESACHITPKSKLGQMAFMQRAEAAQKATNDEEIRQIRLAMEENAGGTVASDDEYQEPVGRQKFGKSSQPPVTTKQTKLKNEFEARLSDSEGDDDILPPESMVAKQAVAINPVKAMPRSILQADASIKAQQPRVKLATKQLNGNKANRPSPHKSRTAETSMGNDTSPSEFEDDSQALMNPDEAKAALAASIFAGSGDALQEFAKEKAEKVEEEGDQVVDNTLPGWGSWTGTGISKREQRKGKGRFLTTVKGVAPEKRQDAKLDRVIVNEKRVKKNGKYLATELPHPFETRQQYERSLRLPIGPEWSTSNHYQDSIKPRVLLKQGTVIRPIAKPIV